MTTYSVDRIVGEYAVLVGESAPDLSVLLSELPEGIKEGCILHLENGVYRMDRSEEEERRAQILALQNKLRRKNR